MVFCFNFPIGNFFFVHFILGVHFAMSDQILSTMVFYSHIYESSISGRLMVLYYVLMNC